MVNKVIDLILDALFWIAAAALAIATVGVTASVIMRSAGRPPSGVSDLSTYMVLLLAMFASPRLLRDGGHIAIDVLPLSEGVKRRVDVVTSVVGAAVFGYLAYYALRLTVDLAQSGSALESVLRLPRALLTGVVLVGTAALSIQFLRNAITIYQQLDSNSRADPAQSKSAEDVV